MLLKNVKILDMSRQLTCYLLVAQLIFIQIQNPLKLKLSGTRKDVFSRENPQNQGKFYY